MNNKQKYEETKKRLHELLSKLKPIECMGFKCRYAFPDEYNWAECEQDLKGYIVSFGKIEGKIICPFFIEKEL